MADPETARAILDGTLTAYCLDGTDPLTAKQAAEFLCGGEPEIIRMCLPYITRKRDDSWWNGVLMTAKLPEGLKLVLDHGVDVDIPFEGGYTMLHHLATPSRDAAGRSRFRGGALQTRRCCRRRALLTIRDSLLRSTPLGWACRWGKSSSPDCTWSAALTRPRRMQNCGQRLWHGRQSAGITRLSNCSARVVQVDLSGQLPSSGCPLKFKSRRQSHLQLVAGFEVAE